MIAPRDPLWQSLQEYSRGKSDELGSALTKLVVGSIPAYSYSMSSQRQARCSLLLRDQEESDTELFLLRLHRNRRVFERLHLSGQYSNKVD